MNENCLDPVAPKDDAADRAQRAARPIVIESLDPLMVEVLRQKTPAERLEIAAGMWRSAREMLKELTRSEHPDWTEQQVLAEVARRMMHGSD